MRKVLKNAREVFRKWADRAQPEGRRGNVYFDGETCYSDGPHFPIARHVPGTNGQPGILFNRDRYSVSTARHQS
jgi:hypothetical protein